MGKIDLSHWFVGENSLSNSLLNFWVDINIKSDNNNIYAQLEIIDGNMQRFVFDFATLEEAVNFTENVINKYKSIQKIAIIYEDEYSKKSKKNRNRNKNKDIKIALTPDEMEQAIIDYFGFNKNYRISVVEKVGVDKGNIDVKYYLLEHVGYSGLNKDNKILLTEGDLRKVLNKYIKLYNYELVDFEYLGDVYNSTSENSIYYNGVELSVKEKGKKLVLD